MTGTLYCQLTSFAVYTYRIKGAVW